MKEEFVTYNQALVLKELGFDEPCFGFYSVLYDLMITQTNGKKSLFELECLAPLKQQVFRWFREKHKLHSNAIIAETNCGFKIQYLSDYTNQWFASYESYEQAESACIDKLIEIVKNK